MSPALEAALAAHCAARGPDLLQDGPRGRVTRVPWGDAHAVVKEHRPRLRARLERWVRGSRARRAEAAARALRAAGFPVPEPLAVVDDGGRDIYLAEHVPGPTLTAALAAADRPRAQALALAAADLAGRLHAAGFAVRDLKPDNLVVTAAGPVLVDLGGVRRVARVPWRLVVRNLAALDAYAQLGPRPLAVGARIAALRHHAAFVGPDAREHLSAVLGASRVKRRRIAARTGLTGGDSMDAWSEP